MLYWRNMKIKILIGLCVLGLIGFVVLIIVQTTKNKWSIAKILFYLINWIFNTIIILSFNIDIFLLFDTKDIKLMTADSR